MGWGQNRFALLVGIGNYSSESGWPVIHGNNDISLIRQALIRQGFSDESIILLCDSVATKENILSAFDKIASIASTGDLIYIHFSGHGQQITDLNGDETDGFDEAWIPYDAKKQYEAGVYEGEKHLIDDELNTILARLRIRVGVKGKLIVVADACHSGSGSRGLPQDTIFVRGSGDKFIIPERVSNIKRKSPPTDWLFIAACKPYQSNYEYKSPGGKYYGILSYVIANEKKRFDVSKYVVLLEEWSREVSEKSRYPQDIDNEGRPSRNNSYMF